VKSPASDKNCLCVLPFERIKIVKPTEFLFAGLISAGFSLLAAPNMAYAQSHTAMPEHGIMHVTKSPTCGCCTAWVALARDEGFEVRTVDVDNISTVKSDAQVPGDLWACHTATIDGYVVEGHVPFAAIVKMLAERPQIAGIAVPGMPIGSPGMGNDPSARFDVISFGGAALDGEVFFQAGS
jgi:hypothetical protein